MKKITLACLSLLSLSSLGACSSGYEGWSYAQIADYEARMAVMNGQLAQMNQNLALQNQQRMAQLNQPMNIPQGYSYAYTDPQTSIVYCRNLSGSVIACKQIR